MAGTCNDVNLLFTKTFIDLDECHVNSDFNVVVLNAEVCDLSCKNQMSLSDDRLVSESNCDQFKPKIIGNNISSMDCFRDIDNVPNPVPDSVSNVDKNVVTNCCNNGIVNSNMDDFSLNCDYNVGADCNDYGATCAGSDINQTVQNAVEEISYNSCVEHSNEDLSKFSKNNAKNMIFSHLNVNSLSCKFMEIHELLVKGHSDILFLSETKLDMSFPNAQFHIDKFLSHRLDRNLHGGGLMCSVKENNSS